MVSGTKREEPTLVKLSRSDRLVLNPEEDACLVRRVRCAEGAAERRHAFGLLVARHEVFLRNMLRQLCARTADADDLAQEAFVTAWMKLDSLRTPEHFRPWLKQLAYRKFLGVVRRERVEQRYLQMTTDNTAHSELEAVDDLDMLLGRCTPLERELVVLHYGFGFTYGELAVAQGIPQGTIKSHIHRAKKAMNRVQESTGAPSQTEIKNE